MKKQLSKCLAAGIVLALALALTACGGTSSAEDIMVRAQEAFDDIHSMHYSIDMDMAFSAEGESISMKTTAEADCVVDPMALDMDMTVDMMGLFDMTLKMYLVQDGDSFITYTGIDDGEGGMSWSKEVMDNMGEMAQYDGQASMKVYLDNISSFKEAGTEEINGVTAVRYDGVIAQDSLKEVLEASGTLEQYESMGIEGLDDLLSEMGDLPVSIWIDPDTCLPVKYEMDMTKMMQSMMDKLLAADEETAETEMTVDKCAIVMLCSDYNAIDSIEIPQEALDAPSSDEMMTDLFSDEESELLEEAVEDAA